MYIFSTYFTISHLSKIQTENIVDSALSQSIQQAPSPQAQQGVRSRECKNNLLICRPRSCRAYSSCRGPRGSVRTSSRPRSCRAASCLPRSCTAPSSPAPAGSPTWRGQSETKKDKPELTFSRLQNCTEVSSPAACPCSSVHRYLRSSEGILISLL